MRDSELFYQLKEEVLGAYRNRYPFYQGDWKTFGARDIQNLIDAIEKETRQTISEKWIYTHLKPETNEKLPRKDMLDILSRFVGYSGWDEFIFKSKEGKNSNDKKRSLLWVWVVSGIVVTGILAYGIFHNNPDDGQNAEPPNNVEKTLPVTEEADIHEMEPDAESQTDTTVSLEAKENQNGTLTKHSEIAKEEQTFLEPEDYKMILKAFMQSDIKDWATRKQQLDKILSPELEVIVMLGDNLGAEYFNKPEFSQKLIVPTASVRKMKIMDLQTDANNKVRFIRIQQE